MERGARGTRPSSRGRASFTPRHRRPHPRRPPNSGFRPQLDQPRPPPLSSQYVERPMAPPPFFDPRFRNPTPLQRPFYDSNAPNTEFQNFNYGPPRPNFPQQQPPPPAFHSGLPLRPPDQNFINVRPPRPPFDQSFRNIRPPRPPPDPSFLNIRPPRLPPGQNFSNFRSSVPFIGQNVHNDRPPRPSSPDGGPNVPHHRQRFQPYPKPRSVCSSRSSSRGAYGRRSDQALSKSSEVIDKDRRGVIAEVDDRGFGYISVTNEEGRTVYDRKLFVHQNDMTNASLTVGLPVIFDVVPGRKGHKYQTENVRSGLGITDPDCQQDKRGEVIEYDVVKNCGLVRCLDSNATLLVQDEYLIDPEAYIAVDQILKFDIEKDSAGIAHAVNIEILSKGQIPDDESNGSCDLPSSGAASEYSEFTASELQTSNPESELTVKELDPTETNAQESDLLNFADHQLECSICCEIVSEGDSVTPCEHYFCRPCIKAYLMVNRNCPNCRASLTVSDLQSIPRLVRNLIEQTRKLKI